MKFKIGQVEFIIEIRANKEQQWTQWAIIAPIGNDQIEITGSYNPHIEQNQLQMELNTKKRA